MRRNHTLLNIILFMVAMGFYACGDGKSKKSPSGPGGSGPTDQAFHLAAQQQQVPYRLLLSIAYLESQINPNPASVVYPENESKHIGSRMAKTAFGPGIDQLTALELESSEPSIQAQVDAYASLLRRRLDQEKLILPANPQTSDEKFDWVWFAAKINRETTLNLQTSARKDVAVVFSLDLIEIMNKGFVWQSADGKELIQLAADPSPIDLNQLSFSNRQILRLNSPLALLSDAAMSMALVTANTNEADNHPTRVIITHCPFNLSLCLEIQNYQQDGDVRLQAHYVIPQRFDENGIFRPIEITDPRRAVTVLDSQGKPSTVKDAIVIMLAGQSGRYINSIRYDANPLWLNHDQLLAMGQMIHSACRYINSLGNAEYSRCVNPDDKKFGPLFMEQVGEDSYRWGEIPDYEKEIFREYLVTQSGPFSAVAFKFAHSNGVFQAGDINFVVDLPIEAKYVYVQKLTRCSNGKTVWKDIFSTEVRSQRQISFVHGLFDAGPNNNGSQFLRAKVYSQTAMSGWSVDKLHILGFENEPIFDNFEACRL